VIQPLPWKQKKSKIVKSREKMSLTQKNRKNNNFFFLRKQSQIVHHTECQDKSQLTLEFDDESKL